MSNRTRLNNKGFGMMGVLLTVVVVVAVVGTGAYLYHKHSVDNKKVNSTTSSTTNTTTSTNHQGLNTAGTDPYAGWKTYCVPTVKACVKYPSDWVTSQYGGLQNSACTEYASLTGPTNKDTSSDIAYIVSIDDFSTSISSLKIVGMVVNNKPSYSVYNAPYLSQNNIQVGATQAIADVNYNFTGNTGNAGLVGTPCANGYSSITTLDQAKDWFNTAEGKTVLKVIQSFYYE